MAKHRISQTTPRDSSGSLVFDAKIRWWTTPLPPEICAQSDPPPFQTPNFRPISAHSASTVRAREKSSITANRSRPRAFQRAIDEPCTLPLSPPKGGSKWKCLHLALPFISSLQVIIDISTLITWVKHNMSLPTDDKMSLKWALPCHVTNFKLLVPLRYLWNVLS